MFHHTRLFILILVISPTLANAGEGQAPREIRELDVLLSAVAEGASLDNSVIRGLDFRQAPVVWRKIDVSGAVFLGCKFDDKDESLLVGHGALIFPGLPALPYDPYRLRLYTPLELFAAANGANGRCIDQQIYDYYVDRGKYRPGITEALAERIHDHAIDRALSDYLEIDGTNGPRRKVVAIMGGHSTRRDDPCYEKVALLTYGLARRGYLVSTGGGPGMMEAGNLGAYLAEYRPEAVKDAVAMMAIAPDGKSPEYDDKAKAVLKKYPKGRDSLAIPTWFYGQEPCNRFGNHVAKYFSNAIREDVLLSTATCGVVFTPGSAGTTQEVFMTAAQNHYGSFGYYCPMAFFGTKRYVEDTKIYGLVKELAKGKEYEKLITISDDPDRLVEFIRTHPPQKATKH